MSAAEDKKTAKKSSGNKFVNFYEWLHGGHAKRTLEISEALQASDKLLMSMIVDNARIEKIIFDAEKFMLDNARPGDTYYKHDRFNVSLF